LGEKNETSLRTRREAALTLVQNTEAVIELAQTPNKDVRSRLNLFTAWLIRRDLRWYEPDLPAYRDLLLGEREMAATSVSAHLSTIRAAYRRILRQNLIRDGLYAMTPPDASPADRKAFVDEILIRARNAIDPVLSPVDVITYQDYDERESIRLTGEQASLLMKQPGVGTLKGLRDTAIIAALLCTGVREGELVNVLVSDLRAKFGREVALKVRKGKGSKSRLIPYGDLDWVLQIIDRWLNEANIRVGPVFRGFYRGMGSIRSTALTTRAIEYIMGEYDILINGERRTVRPHDCRRTYARRLFESEMDLVAIQQNLGHADLKTTLRYIGTLDEDQRRAGSVYDFDLSMLDEY
jgi:site-specific recombinase XerD